MSGLSDNQNVSPLIRNYYDLDVYKKAFQISIDVHKKSLKFPKIEQYALADQLRRASKGICANIAEGFAKQQASKPEFRRFLLMALGSAHEMHVWIDYCRELEYVDENEAKHWISEYSSITKMLQSFINKI